MTYDATVVLVGKDLASSTIDQGTKNILNNYRVMRQEVKSVTAEFALQNQTLVAAQGVFRSVGSVAGSLMNIYTQFQTSQIRVTNAQNGLILAQLNYNQVLAQQGPGTNEAIAASISLSEAKQNVAQATQQETIGYIGMAFELGSTVSLMIGSVPKIKEFTNAMRNAKIAAAEANSVGSASPIAGIVGGAAGAGAVGGKLGTLAKIGGGVAGAGLIAGGLLTGGENQDFGTKLASVGQTAGGGALLGATVGSIVPGLGTAVGAGIGGVAGLAVGIAQNFGQEISDWFNRITNNGQSQASQVGKESVVTIKIQNETDHKISTIEQSMGIQQVMQSHQ